MNDASESQTEEIDIYKHEYTKKLKYVTEISCLRERHITISRNLTLWLRSNPIRHRDAEMCWIFGISTRTNGLFITEGYNSRMKNRRQELRAKLI